MTIYADSLTFIIASARNASGNEVRIPLVGFTDPNAASELLRRHGAVTTQAYGSVFSAVQTHGEEYPIKDFLGFVIDGDGADAPTPVQEAAQALAQALFVAGEYYDYPISIERLEVVTVASGAPLVSGDFG